MSLEEFYRHFRAGMDPDDETARERFYSIVSFLRKTGIKATTVLDLCAGTGIAGVAAVKAFSASQLTLLDKREEDMFKVTEWLEVGNVRPSIFMVSGDVLSLPELVGTHDSALLFGHTMAHFNPFEAIRLFSAVSLVLNEEGSFILEEVDRIKKFLFSSRYRDFIVEATGKTKVVSLHKGYEVKRGVERRAFYRLPEFEEIAELDIRLWDLASLVAMGKIFFKASNLVTPEEHGIQGLSNIILMKKPKKDIALRIYSEFRNL